MSKSIARTRAAAQRIAEEVTGRRAYTSRQTEQSWRFRQFPPDECVEGTESTQAIRRGVSIVTCTRRGGR